MLEGTRCETDVDECSSQPCQHGGSCVTSPEVLNYYQCNCADGYVGVNCEDDADECLSSPCQQGGQCHNLVNGFDCSCPAGIAGK